MDNLSNVGQVVPVIVMGMWYLSTTSDWVYHWILAKLGSFKTRMYG